jgi:peptidoglycan hydrolase-like protein with peptidoglycan-binding domain
MVGLVIRSADQVNRGVMLVDTRRLAACGLVGAVCFSALPLVSPAQAATVAAPVSIVAAPGQASWMNWSLAPSLRQLLNEVNARWPNRSRASDGTLGDARHSASRSEHNPVGSPNGPRFGTVGSVHAIDITSRGIDVQALLKEVVGDSRVWYVIHNRTIWSRTSGWAPRFYFGSPHVNHVHISLRGDDQASAVVVERDTRLWFSSPVVSSSAFLASPQNVRALQQALIARGFAIPAGATGTFGSQTRAAVAAFQRSQGWRGGAADGAPGPGTLSRLGLGGGGGPAYVQVSYASRPAPAPARPAAPAAAGSFAVGATGPHVSALQRALIARGFAIPAGATGKFGGQTMAAVAAFQRSQGWSGSSADGVPGPGTLARLGMAGGAAAPAAARPAAARPAPAAAGGSFAVGATGSHVSALQRALIARGFAIPAGATGKFGGQTMAAVAAFQRSQGWSGSLADGVPGPGTLARLGLR